MSTRISFTIPEYIAHTLDTISERAGYKTRGHFLRALTEYAAAAIRREERGRPLSIGEEIEQMFAELEAVEAPEYGAVPTRHPHREM